MQRNLTNPRLKDKIALVTGGSRGLGAAICLLFAQEGARVGVNYRQRSDKADEIVREITAAGGEALAVAGDVAVDADARSMVQETVEAFGGIDILVNNAGITFYRPFLEHSEEDWDHVMGVNLKSLFSVLPLRHPAHDLCRGRGNHEHRLVPRLCHTAQLHRLCRF